MLFRSLRCAMNVGMDYYWFGKDAANQTEMMSRLLNFFKQDNFTHEYFNVDGSAPAGNYSTGMIGANAVGFKDISAQKASDICNLSPACARLIRTNKASFI